MSPPKIKTEHSGPKRAGGFWGTKADAKRQCKRLRRSADRWAVREQL